MEAAPSPLWAPAAWSAVCAAPNDELLEDVAGEDGVERFVAEVRGVELREIALDDPVEPLAGFRGGAGVEFYPDDLARAGPLEERAVVAAAAAEVEHAQAARVDQLQKGGLGVAEVAGGHIHRRIIQPRREAAVRCRCGWTRLAPVRGPGG